MLRLSLPASMVVALGFLLAGTSPAIAGTGYLDQFEIPAGAAYAGAHSCLDCHDDVAAAYAHSPHAVDLGLAVPGTGAASCEACHGPGSLHVAGDGEGFILGAAQLGGLDEDGLVLMCTQCHTGQGLVWGEGHHVGTGTTCASCHADQVHFAVQALPAADYRNPAEFCLQCHPGQVADFRMPFRHRVLEGQVGCADCHDPHAGFATGWNGLNETCLACHVEMSGPFVFEHDGVAGEDCTICHRPHGSLNDKLLVQDGNGLCLQCHFESGLTFGDTGHQGILVNEARCYDCHGEVHGSHTSPTLGYN